MAADPPVGPELRGRDDSGTRFEVDARGAMGVQVGAGSVMINVFRSVAAPPLDRGSGVIESPYRGLAAFERRDAGFFFGREEAAGQVLGRMSRALDGPGLVMVSGVSGVGKSSLLRAGVLPGVLRGGLAGAPGAAAWPLLMFTPGPAPLDELAALVAPLAGAEAGTVRGAVAAGPAGFALIARQAAMAGAAGPHGGPDDVAAQPRRLLLVIDQFEQLFTQCADEEQRSAFIAALHAAATAGHGPRQRPAALVVLGVRADFEPRCAAYPVLFPAVQDRYLVEAMGEEQLRMAITEPARKLGARVDDALVSRLLREVRSRQPAAGAGVLPLLSHALDQAWRGRGQDVHGHAAGILGVADYERTGGIERAVASSAQRTYDGLSRGQQATARQVFTRLTATTSDGIDTAVPVSTAELTAGKNPSRARDVEAVLEAFTAERLLIRAAGTVEISHEILLTAWPLLHDTWLAETHADRIARTRLQGAAADWAGHDRDASYLYRGTLLASATEAAGRISADPARHLPLSQRERDFLQASNRTRRRAGRTRQAVTAILAVLVIGLGATTSALNTANAGLNAANHDAIRQRDVAVSIELADQSEALTGTNATAAARDAIAAWTISHTSQARYAMLNAAASPQVAAITTGTAVYSLAFTKGGKEVATIGGNGTALLSDATTGRPISSPLQGENGTLGGEAFSPDGRILATVSSFGGAVQLWTTTTHRRIGRPFATSTTTMLAFSPDGKVLATAGWGPVQLWGVTSAGARPMGKPFGAGTGWVAFSPGGTRLATITRTHGLPTGGPVQLWDVTGGTARQAGRPFADGTDWVAFSPNRTRLATTTWGQGLQLWDVTGAAPRKLGVPFASGTASAWFSPDGTLLATAVGFVPAASSSSRIIRSAGKGVQLWNVATRRPTGAPVGGFNGGADTAAFSADGSILATAGADGIARLWSVARITGRLISRLDAGDVAPGTSALALSPDGTTLAAAVTGNSTVQLWNTGTRKRVGKPFASGTGWVVFSPDGATLAVRGEQAYFLGAHVIFTTGGVGPVQLWNTRSGKMIGSPFAGDNGGAYQAAFSPDGAMLVTIGADGAARLWNATTRQQIGNPIWSGTSSIESAAFSSDSTVLATEDNDGNARLWDIATDQQIGSPISDGIGSQNQSAAFLRNDTVLAIGEGTLQDLMDVSYLTDPLARLCSQAGGSFTPSEWTQHVPPGPAYRNGCPQPLQATT